MTLAAHTIGKVAAVPFGRSSKNVERCNSEEFAVSDDEESLFVSTFGKEKCLATRQEG
jgi:hypothetical protein